MGSAIHIDELTKLPFLFHHYHEHKSLHPDDSALVFLYKHYILQQKAESEKDKKSDSQLPFKSDQKFNSHLVSFNCGIINNEIVCQITELSFIPFAVSEVTVRSVDIWQPPKI